MLLSDENNLYKIGDSGELMTVGVNKKLHFTTDQIMRINLPSLVDLVNRIHKNPKAFSHMSIVGLCMWLYTKYMDNLSSEDVVKIYNLWLASEPNADVLTIIQRRYFHDYNAARIASNIKEEDKSYLKEITDFTQ